jgi:hypothetical protein
VTDEPVTLTAWSVWTAWRGEPRLWAQVLRHAIDAVRVGDETVDCRIAVLLEDDIEHFAGPQDWLDGVTSSARGRFDEMVCTIEGSAATLRIHAAALPRADPPPPGWEAEDIAKSPVIVVRATSRSGGDPAALLERVAGPLHRGGFSFTHDPVVVDRADALPLVVEGRVANRFRWLEIPYAAVVLLVGLASFFGEPPTPSVRSAPFIHGALLVVSGLVATFLVIAAVALVFGLERWTPFARIRRQVHRLVFPAIEIADRRPGRRVLGTLSSLAAAVAVPVFKQVVGL